MTFMKKDHTVSEAYEAIERLQAAGLIYDAHIMTGVAGRGRGQENADALAHFLNQTHPAHVVNFSMFIHQEVPLYREIKKGNYVPADELESLREEKRLLEQLNIPVKYEGFHDYLQIRVRGKDVYKRQPSTCSSWWYRNSGRYDQESNRPWCC